MRFQAFSRAGPGEFATWQLCTRFDIPSRDDPNRVYLTRWRLLQTPWFGVYLHRIHEHDTDPWLHDHPWSFVSVVLRGGYDEKLARGGVNSRSTAGRRRWLSIARRRATDLHRITRLHRKPTWTLIIAGRRVRRWGFRTNRGWVDYRTYFGLDAEQ